RDRRCSSGFPHPRIFNERIRQFHQSLHAVSEVLKSWVLRLATPEAVVNLLQNHRQLEDAKYFVVTDLREVASSSLRITLNELVSRVPTGLRCKRGHSASAQLRRLNPSPVTQRQTQIGQWIANRRHLPIEHRVNLNALGRVSAEHNVIQLVIVMHQGG